jgi:large subunit ribosomal protein L9
MIRLSFSLFVLLITPVLAAPASRSSWSKTASFVPPASPTMTRSNPVPTETIEARDEVRSRGYGLYDRDTRLWSKKKAPASPKKIQVKLLKNIVGTGVYGEVIMVTPAFFSNKLLPEKAAVIISDEEVAKQNAEVKAQDKATNAAATALKTILDEVTITIKRKAGPDGQLFGGIGPKILIDELKAQVKDQFLESKSVKVVSTSDEHGEKLSHDIKHVGTFTADLALTKDVIAKITIVVDEER